MSWIYALLLVASCSAGVGCAARIVADVPAVDVQIQQQRHTCVQHYHREGNYWHCHR